MLLFGYILAEILSLWFISQRKEIIFLKNSLFTKLKVGLRSVMLALTFMSYKLTNRVVWRTNWHLCSI